MSTDRELLKFAAKAAGIEISDFVPSGGTTLTPSGEFWNPLLDLCEALRLAVTLRLDIELHALAAGDFRRVTVTWSIGDWDGGVEQDNEFGSALSDERMVCRAIVRAAAEIGKAMP